MIGEFEYLVLTSALRLGEEAYGATIRLDVESISGRSCSVGALYTTLDRLESKKLIQTSMGDATPQRGGRPKRMVRLTLGGLEAATEFRETILRASRGIEWKTSPKPARS